MPTLTSVIKDNQLPGETMTQCLHRMKDANETLTHEMRDQLDGSGIPPVIPAPPTGFAAPTSSAVTATGAKITWTAPTGGDAVTSYEVNVSIGIAPIAGSPFTMAGSTLSKTLTGLTTATDYEVDVKAINGDGNVLSPTITVTTA